MGSYYFDTSAIVKLYIPVSPLTFVSADNDLLATAAVEGLATDNPNQHL